jgi:very-short-patch-repair endonuclease
MTFRCQRCDGEYRAHRSKAGRTRFCSRSCANLGRPLPPKKSAIASSVYALLAERHPDVPMREELRMGRWAIDIALTEHRIAIEIDGTYWHSLPGIAEKDARKDAFLRARGWVVERFPVNRESAEEVVARIEARLPHISPTVPAER